MGDYEEIFDPVLGKNRTKDIFTGSGLLSINGLTPVAQLLAVASVGSDFNISSSGATHTFNLPTASALNRGALSPTDWNTFNNKLSNISGQPHSILNQLDYASAGHTGFEKSLTFSTGLTRTGDTITTNDSQIVHNNLNGLQGGVAGQYNHLTNTELGKIHDPVTVSDTVSVDLTLIGQQISADVLPAGVDHNQLLNTHNLTTDIDHNSLLNTHNLTTDIDHDQLLNYVANKHIDHSGVNIDTTAPLQGGGDITATRTLSITQATTSTDGYLSSVDWNTFNNKLSVETDPIFTASPAFGIASGDITNWNTAYGWGDHAAEGYLKNIVEDTTPQLGADLDTNSNDIKFLDNDKAIFGTGLDGEIYVDALDDFYLRNITSNKDLHLQVNVGGIQRTLAFLQGSTRRVGINTTSPTVELEVSGQFRVNKTFTAGTGSLVGNQFVTTLQNSAVNNATVQAGKLQMFKRGDANATGVIEGFLGLVGLQSGLGDLANAVGARYQIQSTGQGDIINARAIYLQNPFLTSSGSITNLYGLYVDDMSTFTGGGSGTITNCWGLYIDGSNCNNYIAGDTGFGLSNPSEKLHSSAKVRADTVFNINGTDGVSGSFTTTDAKTVTVVGGIITAIV